MNKGLEALEHFQKRLLNYDEWNFYDLEIVKEALQRLEAIENSNPSEALEILLKARQVCDVSCITMCNNCQKRSAYNSVKVALLKAQENENARAFGKDIINLNKTLKQSIDEPILYASRYGNKYIVPQELFEEQKKVLKILIEKNVDILAIKESKTLEDYNRNAWEVEHYGKYNGYRLQLTQEEFDTLKRYVDER